MRKSFEVLGKIDVSGMVETKQNLKYLSWSKAWAEACKNCDPVRTIYKDINGNIYHTDGRSCWVEVGVTIDEVEHVDYLPVMDYRNKAIPLDKVTSMDVNKAIQRSTTKALALHGLGLSVYSGEDLPVVPSLPSIEEVKSWIASGHTKEACINNIKNNIGCEVTEEYMKKIEAL